MVIVMWCVAFLYLIMSKDLFYGHGKYIIVYFKGASSPLVKPDVTHHHN